MNIPHSQSVKIIHGNSAMVKKLALLVGFVPALALSQLRVCEWNVTNYSATGNGTWRDPSFQTALFDSFNGRSLKPDILVCEEFKDAAGQLRFLNLLNTAIGSPGDYAAAPWIAPGADTTDSVFYRTSKATFLNVTRFFTATGSTSIPPRDLIRYDFLPVGYNVDPATIAIYANHMKASSTAADLARRLQEAQMVRTNAESLPASWVFMMCADLNIQDSSQPAYQELIGSKTNNSGRFFDPINTPGNWENNGSFQYVHTQEPGTQMDSRFDQILVSGDFMDAAGNDYLGAGGQKFSTTTWNDPAHSYRCWGNDGSTFNTVMRVAGNTNVGPTIAQALINTCTETQGGVSNGHLPVFADFKVPAKANATTVFIDFGFVDQGDVVTAPIGVINSADQALWTANGISNLHYSFSADSNKVVLPIGSQTSPAGQLNTHNITLNTSQGGIYNGTITITTDSPTEPVLTVNWSAVIVGTFNPDPPRKWKRPGG